MTFQPPPPPTLLNLNGLETSALPPASATPDQLTPLISTLLQEALPLLESTKASSPDNNLWKSKGIKHLAASTAPIHLTERVLPGTHETWACRRSVHADVADTRGTASWAEFARCLRDEHAATEDAFTPTVLAHREARAWPAAGEVAPMVVAAAGDGPRRWGGFVLVLVEMKHRIPPPLQPRVFAVLQLVARAMAGEGEAREVDDFVVVSVPVGDFAEQEGLGVLSREKGVVVGAYAAVERVRRIGDEGKEIEWVMATASDARGVLPMFVQTKAIPGQIAKDVDLFLGWIEGERRK